MNLMGVHIDGIRLEEARKRLDEPQIIFTPNPEILLEARKNPAFFKALQAGTLMLPDGNGLCLVSRLRNISSKWLRAFFLLPSSLIFLVWKKPFRREIPEIIHGSDFMRDVISWAEHKGKSVFFLGGAEGIAEKTAAVFMKAFPNLKLAGFRSGNPDEASFEAVLKSKAEILFVAFGAPKQELWIAKYAHKLNLHLAMGVGGSFDFYAGKRRRAPRLFQKLGLEWFWRLMLHPMERTRRIWNATVVFPFLSLFVDD